METTTNSPARTGRIATPLPLPTLSMFDTIIDVRSPSEFAEDHIPGALNYPVLSDDERVIVGTCHKQQSAFDAKKLGAALVARNIAVHLEHAFAQQPKSWKPLVYCWRGGSRSGAMTHILRSIGWSAVQLEGGYKAWRGQVIRELESLAERFSYRIICGRTGSGKSRFLDALAADSKQVLDLERLAAHKGSVLGDLPDEPQPSQKMFESRIWTALSQFDPTRPIFVEAESKRVGNLRVPERLMERMRISHCIELVASDSTRVALLREEYAHLIANPALLFQKLDCLTALHSAERIHAWKAAANAQQWDQFVQEMLVQHYDPAYERSMFQNYVEAKAAAPLVVSGITPAHFLILARQLSET